MALLACKKGARWSIDKDLSEEGLMNARPKKKLCWNCEGNVSLKAENCPYCGVSVVGLSSEISSETPTPPYRLVNPAQEPAIPVSPFADSDVDEDEDVESAPAHDEVAAQAPLDVKDDDSKKVVLVLTLLAAGSIFFIFGFALLLFSDEGYLSLHWNAAYWFVYLLLALPMLFIGFRKLNALTESN